jgi:hypothetical protein
MGEDRKVNKVLVRKPKERDYLYDRGVDERIGSDWTLERFIGGVKWIKLAQDGGGLLCIR